MSASDPKRTLYEKPLRNSPEAPTRWSCVAIQSSLGSGGNLIK